MNQNGPRKPLPADSRRRFWWLARLHDAAALAIVAGFALLLWQRRQDLVSVLEVSVLDLFVLSMVVAVTWIVVAGQNFLLYRASGIPVGFWECVLLMAGSGFGNYLPMRLGTVVRAHYLKSVHGFRYARFGSVFGIRTVLLMGASGVLGMTATLVIARGSGRWSGELFLGFALLTAIPVCAWLVPLPPGPERPSRLRAVLHDFAEGARLLREQPLTSVAVTLLVLTQQLALAARFGVASAITGADLSPGVLLLLAPLAVLTAYLSVTPGGIGVREALMGYATFATGSSFSQGLYVGTIDRAVQIVMVAVLGGIGFGVMWWRSRQVAPLPPRS